MGCRRETVRNNLSRINKKFHPRRDDNEQAGGMVAPSRCWHDCVPDVTQPATSAKASRKGEKEKKATDGRDPLVSSAVSLVPFLAPHPTTESFTSFLLFFPFFLFFFSLSPRRVISKSPKQPGKRSRRAERRRLERKEERKVAEEDVGGFGERERGSRR